MWTDPKSHAEWWEPPVYWTSFIILVVILLILQVTVSLIKVVLR